MVRIARRLAMVNTAAAVALAATLRGRGPMHWLRRRGSSMPVDDETTMDELTGAVRSRQVADVELSERALDEVWSPPYLERLARTYWRFLARVTLGLVHVRYGDGSRSLDLLVPALPLLTFAAPEYETAREGGLVRWRIEGGLLVARRAAAQHRAGHLQIEVRRMPAASAGQARLRIEVEVASFYPAIAFTFGRRLYNATQGRIHVLLTRAFLRSLARGGGAGAPRLAISRVGALAAAGDAQEGALDDAPRSGEASRQEEAAGPGEAQTSTDAQGAG